jgi:antitoxin YefM
MKTMTLTDARNGLLGLAEELRGSPGTVVKIEKHGKPAMTLISSDLYDSLVETLEILSDEAGMKSLRTAIHQVEHGKTMSHEDVKKRLGLA